MRTLTLASAAVLIIVSACAQVQRPDAGPPGFQACDADRALTDLAVIAPGPRSARTRIAVACAAPGAAPAGGHVGIWRLEAGAFVRAGRLDPGGPPSAVDAGDFDGDGDTDLAVITRRPDARRVAIHVNRGEAGFATDPVVHTMGGARIDHAAFHDWNGDGRLDLLMSGGALDTHALAAINRGAGAAPRFSEAIILPDESNLGFSSGDLTGDLSDDLVIALYRRGRLHLYAGGQAQADRIVLYKDARLVEEVIGGGDLNGDGEPDLVSRFWTDAAWEGEAPIPTRLLMSPDEGDDYALGAVLDGAENARRAFVGDFAGGVEIVVIPEASPGQPVEARLYTSDGEGWSPSGRLELGGDPQLAQAGDLNGDGADHLIMGQPADGRVQVYSPGR